MLGVPLTGHYSSDLGFRMEFLPVNSILTLFRHGQRDLVATVGYEVGESNCFGICGSVKATPYFGLDSWLLIIICHTH